MSFVAMFPVYVDFTPHVNSQRAYLLQYLNTTNYMCVWLVLWELCIARRPRCLFETRHSL